METTDNKFSVVSIALLRGPVWREDDQVLWAWLVLHQSRVRDHLGILGLELVLDEGEGFAYMRQRIGDDDEQEVPRLVPRRQLPYHVSLLAALLRRRLAEFDAHAADTRLVLSREDLVSLMRDFFPPATNDVKLVNKISATIEKVVALGFLRRLKGGADRYEVSRIIKAFVDAQWLEHLDAKLAEYRAFAMVSDDEEET